MLKANKFGKICSSDIREAPVDENVHSGARTAATGGNPQPIWGSHAASVLPVEPLYDITLLPLCCRIHL
jgi:hypothetical protein